MKKILFFILAALFCVSDASAQWIQWTYPQTPSSQCANGSCPTPRTAKEKQLEGKVKELTEKLEELENKDAVVTVQPPEDPNALKSDERPVVTKVPTPDEVRADLRGDSVVAGRWTTGDTSEEVERVDRIMREMSDEFGFDLDALEKSWKKFPVYYVGNRSYAGCTFWENGRVRCIEVVSLFDDKTDRVLRHELIHAVLFYLAQNDVSLFMHEASTQQSEPDVRNAYVSRMKTALAADKTWNISSWYSVNTYTGYGIKVYTFGYGVSEYLVSLGGKEWYFAFVLDYSRNGFDHALRSYYGMTVEQFNDGIKAFYLKNNANRDSLNSLLENEK